MLRKIILPMEGKKVEEHTIFIKLSPELVIGDDLAL